MLLPNRGGRVELNLTDGPREGNHADATRAVFAKGCCARIRRCPGRVDIVDHAGRAWSFGHAEANASADVPATLGERQAALMGERPRTREQIESGDAPGPRKLTGEPPRRNLAATPRALGIAGDSHEAVHLRPRHDLRHERRSLAREDAPAALLPGAHERPRAAVVDDGRAGLREREPSPRALGAAPHGPGPRRPAARAHGRRQAGQPFAARAAESVPGCEADRAALGQEHVEHAHDSRLGPE